MYLDYSTRKRNEKIEKKGLCDQLRSIHNYSTLIGHYSITENIMKAKQIQSSLPWPGINLFAKKLVFYTGY
jgi:hypothetical protein